MKSIERDINLQIDFPVLCELIYAGFGQQMVHEFCASAERHGERINWRWCEPCEITSPSQNNDCLVCGSPTSERTSE